MPENLSIKLVHEGNGKSKKILVCLCVACDIMWEIMHKTVLKVSVNRDEVDRVL